MIIRTRVPQKSDPEGKTLEIDTVKLNVNFKNQF